MRKSILGLSAFVLVALATPAMAQDAAEPTPEFTVNGSVAIVTDYRFRGISQTDKDPAIQGSLTVTHKSGVYVSAWSSSIHNYVTLKGTSTQEIDVIGGYKHTLSNGVTLDGGVLYYVYPGNNKGSPALHSDFFEPYADVAYTYGPVTGKVTVNYSPKQKALSLCQTGGPRRSPCESHDNVYLAGDLSAVVPGTKFGVAAHLGHSFGPSYLASTSTAAGAFTDANGFALKKGYTDWNLGVSYIWKSFTLGVSYVDTDTHFITTPGHDQAKAAAVVSLGAAF